MDFPDRLIGIHLDTVVAFPDQLDASWEPDADETRYAERWSEFGATGWGYVAVQMTRPGALAPGLEDSPRGLAAWLLDKFWAWSDNDSLPGTFKLDALAANLSLYWFTNSIGSSIRMYTDSTAEMGPLPGYVSTPTACAIFPEEMLTPSRRLAERVYNVVQYTRFDRGGHFAALEHPMPFLADLRTFHPRFVRARLDNATVRSPRATRIRPPG